MAVIEVNDSNINDIIKSKEKVIIDCFADWCGPCRMLAPIIDELSDEMPNVKFYKLNIDDNDNTVNKYNIMSIPTVLIFENGNLKNSILGLKSKEELKELI